MITDAYLDAISAVLEMADEVRADTGTRNRFTAIMRRLLEDPLVHRRYGPVCVDTCPLSVDAAAVLGDRRPTAFGAYKPLGLRYEHSVPIAILVDQLQSAPDHDAMRQVITDLYRPVWVTFAEDDRLKAAGLNSQMPVGWSADDGPFARYEAVGIEVTDAI